ncbi:MAG: hypothetical protein LBK58_01525 [Prevotellaceae bacterium]|jgi:hypothetical protein|nr:hypothetical protein [Prevotellaceae bacterium]
MEKYLIKFFVLLTALLCSASAVWSQDVIILKKNAEEINALVQEVGLTEVKYKKSENANGPSYTVPKTDIFMIKYANGEKDVFKDAVTPATPTPASPVPTPTASVSNAQNAPVPVNFKARSSTQETIYYYGIIYKEMKLFTDGEHKDCWVIITLEEDSPIYEAGIRYAVIVAIDGEPIDDNSWMKLVRKPEATLSVKGLGDVLVKGIPVQANTVIHECTYAHEDIAGKYRACVTEAALGIEPVSIMSDPEIDFYDYSTFDFEFTDNNSLQQKEIAIEIEKYLTNKLTRDRENPDILVFIEYYSDRSDRYVPPAQELRTRYNTTYNFFTKKWETRRYEETETSRGYTETSYFTKLAISMADAKKMRKGAASQTAIWQADYGVSTKKKPNHKDFGKDIGFCMLVGFPYTVQSINVYTYWFTGILYDFNVPGKVAGVIPNSPADRAGIKAGVIIQKCSYGKNDIFKKSYNKLLEKISDNRLKMFDYEDFDITRTCDIRYERTVDIINSPFVDTYISYCKPVISWGELKKYDTKPVDYDKKPLVFTVKDIDGRTKNITVRPKEVLDLFFALP